MAYDLRTTCIQDFKKLPCWNLNFHRFEGLTTIERAYVAGRTDAYCVLVEEFELSESAKIFTSNEKINSIYFGSETLFLEIFNFSERMHAALTTGRIDLTAAYWLGVEDVFKIYQALYNYTHPRLISGSKVQCQRTHEVYEIEITPFCYRATNSKGEVFREKLNQGESKYIFLDEMFDLEDAIFGKYAVI